jgi:hypothetical protein
MGERGDIILKDSCREKLRQPLGKIMSEEGEIKKALFKKSIITVGDHNTRAIIEMGIKPKVGIVDYKIKRKGIAYSYTAFENLLNAKNPPGGITADSWEKIEEAIAMGNTLLEIDGEEDLMALPAIILSEEGTAVCYGQPDEGMVVVEATKCAKKAAKKFIEICFD